MIRHETADEVCTRFAPALGAAVLRERPAGGFRWKGRYLDLVIVVSSRDEPAVIDSSVPPAVRPLRESYREVFKVLAALRAEAGAAARVMPGHIVARQQADFDRDGVPRDASAHTVNHALAALERAGAVHWARGAGWLLGPPPRARQAEIDFGDGLPSDTRQDAPASRPPNVAYASRVAREPRGRDRREGQAMHAERTIWVPGVEWPGAGGLVVTDARDEDVGHLAEGRVERLRYRDRRGRPVRTAAVRGEVVRVEAIGLNRYATASVRTAEGRTQLKVLVLGDWHLEGRLSESDEPAEVEPAASS